MDLSGGGHLFSLQLEDKQDGALRVDDGKEQFARNKQTGIGYTDTRLGP